MRSVVLLLLVVALAACSNPREEVAKQLANQVLLPAHEQWHASNTALLDSSRAWCADEQAMEDLKRVFHETQTAWARLQPLMVGPLAEGNRSWQVQFWPDKRNMVARQTEALLDEFDDLDQQQLDGAPLAEHRDDVVGALHAQVDGGDRASPAVGREQVDGRAHGDEQQVGGEQPCGESRAVEGRGVGGQEAGEVGHPASREHARAGR